MNQEVSLLWVKMWFFNFYTVEILGQIIVLSGYYVSYRIFGNIADLCSEKAAATLASQIFPGAPGSREVKSAFYENKWEQVLSMYTKRVIKHFW